MIEFSLILPTYNEVENIQVFVPKIISLLEKNQISFEIIVVDDDSADLTWKVAQEKFANDSRISVMRRVGKKGLSSAVLDGMAIAKGKYFGVMDADMQHDESILPKMIEEMKEHEIVVGSRLVGDGGYGEWGIMRKTMSQIATLMAKIMLPIPVKDPMSGYFIVRKELYQELVTEINPIGFKILLEFLGRKKNIKAKEVGYVFKTRVYGETKLSGSVISNYLAALFDIRFGKVISLTFVQYLLVGFTGLLINYAIRYLTSLFWKDGTLSFSYIMDYNIPVEILLGFEVSVITNYWMNNQWTFKKQKIKGLKDNLKGVLQFNMVSFIGLVIQLSVWSFVLGFCIKVAKMDYTRILDNSSNLVGVIFATISNYYLNRNITWKYKV